jgi:hypothetical protein
MVHSYHRFCLLHQLVQVLEGLRDLRIGHFGLLFDGLLDAADAGTNLRPSRSRLKNNGSEFRPNSTSRATSRVTRLWPI